jgi:hypothetical protein
LRKNMQRSNESGLRQDHRRRTRGLCVF